MQCSAHCTVLGESLPASSCSRVVAGEMIATLNDQFRQMLSLLSNVLPRAGALFPRQICISLGASRSQERSPSSGSRSRRAARREPRPCHPRHPRYPGTCSRCPAPPGPAPPGAHPEGQVEDEEQDLDAAHPSIAHAHGGRSGSSSAAARPDSGGAAPGAGAGPGGAGAARADPPTWARPGADFVPGAVPGASRGRGCPGGAGHPLAPALGEIPLCVSQRRSDLADAARKITGGSRT